MYILAYIRTVIRQGGKAPLHMNVQGLTDKHFETKTVELKSVLLTQNSSVQYFKQKFEYISIKKNLVFVNFGIVEISLLR